MISTLFRIDTDVSYGLCIPWSYAGSRRCRVLETQRLHMTLDPKGLPTPSPRWTLWVSPFEQMPDTSDDSPVLGTSNFNY